MPPPVLFADTFYWVAILSPRDPFHARVMSWGSNLGTTRLVTTDEILTEALNWFSGAGPYWRSKAAIFIHNLRNDPSVDVLPKTRAEFDAALALYEGRPDKGYSLTDCGSMLLMRERRLSEALTTDRHFEQEGFIALLRTQ